MSRKKQLTARAYRYAKAREYYEKLLSRTCCRANGFQDGYRAALRDLRKVIKDPHDGTSEHRRVQRFLRPLR